jgi:hypothetical protein
MKEEGEHVLPPPFPTEGRDMCTMRLDFLHEMVDSIKISVISIKCRASDDENLVLGAQKTKFMCCLGELKLI